jgi:predicted Ser/Thr protein kinase
MTMDVVNQAMQRLSVDLRDERRPFAPIAFEAFLEVLARQPELAVRSVFQLFCDLIQTYIGEGHDEYPDDPESIHFVHYDCSRLFVQGTDHPFFADRLFANRLVNLAQSLRRGAQQNKIYIFLGPPGCGKSTFLNNLLQKVEEYANSELGIRYEVLWRVERKLLGATNLADHPVLERMAQWLEGVNAPGGPGGESPASAEGDLLDIPCPSHDNPLLLIPKAWRRNFLDELLRNNDAFRQRLIDGKAFDWVFRDQPCTICASLFEALLGRFGDPRQVFGMIYARPYRFNRRLGEGISIFNPGDKPLRQAVLSHQALQAGINRLLSGSHRVKYLFSQYADTNNGIYALMDLKGHNSERLTELHNIISEGVHKVEDIEENVNSLLMAVANPEDLKGIQELASFTDRIETITIPYVMDLSTEVEIYRHIFGLQIDARFLPRVLHNFARVIISSRLATRSEAMLEWIGDPGKYQRYCDENLQLLKMEIYTGHIPPWLSEEDRKRLTAKRRRRIIAESELEGTHGISGRDSIKIFNEFFSTYGKGDRMINMAVLCQFFTRARREISGAIPHGFLDSLLRMYNYTILQEVKESLYDYNEAQIARDMQNYLFAVNFEPGSVETCSYTGERLEIDEEFFGQIETRLLGPDVDERRRRRFREETQREYAARTLTQEILVAGQKLVDTRLYADLHERYVHFLKEKVLEPFLENENFRRAIKDYGEEAFKSYDKRIRREVRYLIRNLCDKHRYTQQGAKEVCMYVIDSDLARKFTAA